MNLRVLPVLCAMVSSGAFAFGPVVEAGAVIGLRQSVSSGGTQVTINSPVGPHLAVGFELGDRFNHELAFDYTQANTTSTGAGQTFPVSIRTLAGRYTFSVDFLKKEGFSPLLGVGLAAGQFLESVSTQTVSGFYLAFHAVAGARYTFENGLGLKAQLAVSTYGGFVGLMPSLAASWRF